MPVYQILIYGERNNNSMKNGQQIIMESLAAQNKAPFPFQLQTWQAIAAGQSGLVNAPTGSGKTYSVFLGAIIQFINEHPHDYKGRKNNGLQLLWITPLRALAKDIGRAMKEVIADLDMKWQVGIRNGDTPLNERARQKKGMPEILIITPESLHLLLAQKGHENLFKQLCIIAVDEWHELLGSKRAVQVELALSRLVAINKSLPVKQSLCIWGISATIGNMEEAKEVLLSPLKKEGSIIKASIHKKISIIPIMPDEIEKYPWAGHLGLKLSQKTLPILRKYKTTLIF